MTASALIAALKESNTGANKLIDAQALLATNAAATAEDVITAIAGQSDGRFVATVEKAKAIVEAWHKENPPAPTPHNGRPAGGERLERMNAKK